MLHTLFLVPTKFEFDQLSNSFHKNLAGKNCRIEIVGFGSVVSGVRTSHLIIELKPQMVILLGIAGKLSGTAEVGTAVEFDRVACYGVGAGAGSSFETSDEMGWLQWDQRSNEALIESIGCSLSLNPSSDLYEESLPTYAQLLTCCSASSNVSEVELKRSKFPEAIAEDMEGFSVAVACRFSNVPLRIVRGISNVAGERNRAYWKVEAAMHSAEEMVLQILSS